MNSAFIMAVASWSPLLRSRRNESISSMKIILGCVFRARLNNPAINLFDSPNHLFVNTDAAMFMKVAPDSLARALASIVFPHPGGPYSRTPLGAANRVDDERKRAGYRSGMITDSSNEEMMSSRPPISEKVTSMSSGWITSDAIRFSYSSNFSFSCPSLFRASIGFAFTSLAPSCPYELMSQWRVYHAAACVARNIVTSIMTFLVVGEIAIRV